MAATTTAFETEILSGGFSIGDRGVMASPAYRLRAAYLRGMADPAAHTYAKINPVVIACLNKNGKLASFDAITAP